MMIISASAQKIVDFPIDKIKGVMADHIAKLKKQGINTTLQLLDKGTSPMKRKTLNIKTGISDTFLVRMINQADLLRIDSMEPDHAFILETVGVNSVKALEKKTAKEVVAAIEKQKAVLKSKSLFILPDEKQINKWLDEAKKMEKIVQ